MQEAQEVKKKVSVACQGWTKLTYLVREEEEIPVAVLVLGR
jgi:hypothetical protein